MNYQLQKRIQMKKIVTTHKQLKKLYENTYKNRMRHREIKPEPENYMN